MYPHDSVVHMAAEEMAVFGVDSDSVACKSEFLGAETPREVVLSFVSGLDGANGFVEMSRTGVAGDGAPRAVFPI